MITAFIILAMILMTVAGLAAVGFGTYWAIGTVRRRQVQPVRDATNALTISELNLKRDLVEAHRDLLVSARLSNETQALSAAVESAKRGVKPDYEVVDPAKRSYKY